MDAFTRLSLTLSMIILLVAMSCARAPQEDQSPESETSSSADANGMSLAERGESAGLAPESSTRNTPAPDTIMTNQQGNAEYVRVGSPTEFDVHSGDVRGTRYTADGSPYYGIYETTLSKEVRRLGLPIPAQRDWRPLSAGAHFDSVYRNLLPTAGKLLDWLDRSNAPDDERRAVLGTFMTSLRTESPPDAIEEACRLIVEVGDRHGLESPFNPDYTAHLRNRGMK